MNYKAGFWASSLILGSLLIMLLIPPTKGSLISLASILSGWWTVYVCAPDFMSDEKKGDK